MAGKNSFKFVMLPPQTDTTRGWAERLAQAVPEVRVVVAEDAEDDERVELRLVAAAAAGASVEDSCGATLTSATTAGVVAAVAAVEAWRVRTLAAAAEIWVFSLGGKVT